MAIAGDEWLNNTITEKELSKFEDVVVPEPSMLEGEQKKLIDTGKKDGRAVSWKNEKDVLERIKSLVSLRSASKVWILPRKTKQPDTPVVCHVVNWSYNISKDKMTPQRNVDIYLSSKLFDGKKIRKVTLLTPQSELISLQSETVSNGVQVTIPELDLWSMLIFYP